jgi:hypothetical protein
LSGDFENHADICIGGLGKNSQAASLSEKETRRRKSPQPLHGKGSRPPPQGENGRKISPMQARPGGDRLNGIQKSKPLACLRIANL